MQKIHFTVTMIRPDRVRPVRKELHVEANIAVKSDIQLAGFLTHRLFADKVRGKANTFYVIEERHEDGWLNVFTVRRTEDGRYERN
jgi:hypothetical protein